MLTRFCPNPPHSHVRRWAAAFAILIAVVAAPLPASATPLFAAPSLALETGGQPTRLVVADMNGDGTPDLVVANSDYGVNTISVLIGRGDGTFEPRRDFACSRPIGLAVGDVNGDGRMDVVATSGDQEGGLSLLLGRGDGTLDPAILTPGYGSADMELRDLNHDGALDLILGGLGIMLGAGDGTFGPAYGYATLGWAFSLAIGDLNGDGLDDVVVGDDVPVGPPGFQTYVSIFLGNGDGSFGTRHSYPTKDFVSSVTLGDVNGDGRLDVMTAGTEDEVSVLLGNGDGTLGPSREFPTPHYAVHVAVGDLNGDGRPDLAVATHPEYPELSGGGSITVLQGNGDGTFESAIPYLSGKGTSLVTIADLNRDGVPDLTALNRDAATVSVLLGSPGGAFGQNTFLGTVSGPRGIILTDLNRDGRPDLAVKSLSVLLARSDGSWSPSTDRYFYPGVMDLAIGDVNGDAIPDLVLSKQYQTLSVALGNGDGTFGTEALRSIRTTPASVALADMNSDRIPDLVMANGYDPSVSIMWGQGNGTFGPEVSFPSHGEATSMIVTDLDRDGRPDLVVTGDTTISVFPGVAEGTLGPRRDYPLEGWPICMAIGDLNRDGRPDLVVANAWPFAISVMLGTAEGGFGAWTDYAGAASSIAIGDLDGDGIPDVATTDENANAVWVFRGRGDGTLAPREGYGTGDDPVFVAIGDLDRDGRRDLVVADYHSSGINLLRNLGPAPPTPTLTARFRADWAREGVLVSWQAGLAPQVFVERSRDATGPWVDVSGERRRVGDTDQLFDRGALEGRPRFYRLRVLDPDGARILGPIAIAGDPPPAEFAVLPIAPQPARGTARIAFTLPRSARVRLSVLDVQGRRVALLADRSWDAGRYETAWDGRIGGANASPGLYFVRLEWPGGSSTRTLVLTR